MAKEGKKSILKRWWFWVIAIIVIIAVAANMGGESEPVTEPSSGDTASDDSNDNNKEKSEEPKKEEKKTAKIGDSLKVGDVVFKVSGKNTANNVGGEFGSDAQGKYLILNVSVKNEGKESITTDSSFFKLKSGDTEYEADSEAAIYANEDAEFFLQKVNPGIENKGKVVFDVPKDVASSNNLQLQVQTGTFGTETGIIELTK